MLNNLTTHIPNWNLFKTIERNWFLSKPIAFSLLCYLSSQTPLSLTPQLLIQSKQTRVTKQPRWIKKGMRVMIKATKRSVGVCIYSNTIVDFIAAMKFRVFNFINVMLCFLILDFLKRISTKVGTKLKINIYNKSPHISVMVILQFAPIFFYSTQYFCLSN